MEISSLKNIIEYKELDIREFLRLFSLPIRDGNRSFGKALTMVSPLFSLPIRDGNNCLSTSTFQIAFAF